MAENSPPQIGFVTGLRYPFLGARFVFVEHPRLAKFWIPPIVITTLAIAAAAVLSLQWREELLAAVWTSPDGEGWLDVLLGYVHVAAGWVLAVGLFVVSVIGVVLLSSIVAAPFNDALSEAVEGLRGQADAPPITLGRVLGDLRRTVLLECGKLTAYLVVMVPLFVVSLLVPGIGPAIYTVVAFYFTTTYFAVDYLDWPASRRRFGVRQRLSMPFHHFRAMLGFGVGVWLFMYVPLVNLLFMPAAVAGGTLLFLDLHARQTRGVEGDSEPDDAKP